MWWPVPGTIHEALSALTVGCLFCILVPRTQALEVNGTSGCLCLSRDELGNLNNETSTNLREALGTNIDVSTYGIGCYAHDENSTACLDAINCIKTFPVPLGCDENVCSRSWCFVDESCSLYSRPSEIYNGRHYSYATCGELDTFTFSDRMKSLRGQSFNVGFVSNSGGWKGSFNPSGSFTIDNKWEGPVVEFVRESARAGGFSINMTAPPAWLKTNRGNFLGSSSFDDCVYATSLGFLDFCVGGFSIIEKRSLITTMFETTSDPYYLIVFTEDDGSSSLRYFGETLVSLFQPFTGRAWVLILFGFLPFLGCLMFFHEYGAPGSSYPTSEPVMVQRQDGTVEAQTRPISLVKNIMNALYTAILSCFNGSFDLAVVTPGGKVGLLAVSFFIMIVLAVYTANLAAILTQNAQRTSVDSIESAIKAGYNFCAERKLAQIIRESYGVNPEQVVPDPVDIGGDGLPGFNCPDCNARERVFEYMRRSHTDGSLYCNAAIAKMEDLEVLHSNRDHCDKVKVGDALGYQTIGIPIFDKKAPELVAIFHKVKNEGAMTKALVAATPESQCPVPDEEGTALDIPELTGVWIITSAFALLSLFVKCIFVYCRGSERGLRRYDQWLNLAGNDVVVGGYRYDSETAQLLVDDEKENDKMDIEMSEIKEMTKSSPKEPFSSSNTYMTQNVSILVHQSDEEKMEKPKESFTESGGMVMSGKIPPAQHKRDKDLAIKLRDSSSVDSDMTKASSTVLLRDECETEAAKIRDSSSRTLETKNVSLLSQINTEDDECTKSKLFAGGVSVGTSKDVKNNVNTLQGSFSEIDRRNIVESAPFSSETNAEMGTEEPESTTISTASDLNNNNIVFPIQPDIKREKKELLGSLVANSDMAENSISLQHYHTKTEPETEASPVGESSSSAGKENLHKNVIEDVFGQVTTLWMNLTGKHDHEDGDRGHHKNSETKDSSSHEKQGIPDKSNEEKNDETTEIRGSSMKIDMCGEVSLLDQPQGKDEV